MAKTITIDGKKLRRIMAEKNIKMSKASVECGMTESYISNSCSYNYIALAPAMLLEAKYGVMLDDYRAVEPEPEPEKPAEPPVEAAPVAAIPQSGMSEDDWNRLTAIIAEMTPKIDYDKIEKAVAEGFIEGTHALVTTEPVTRTIQQMLFNALNGALKRIRNDLK